MGGIFGSVGLGYFVYGKKQKAMLPLCCGLGLMVFPYFTTNVYLLVLVSMVLIALPFIVRS
jgi:hypothetical protein